MNPLFLNSFLVWITTEDTSLEGGGGGIRCKKSGGNEILHNTEI